MFNLIFEESSLVVLAHFEKVVELDRVRELVARAATSDLGRRAAAALEPLFDLAAVRAELEATTEARTLLEQRTGGRLPLQGIADADGLLRRSTDGGRPLEPQELLDLAAAIRCGLALRRTFEALDRAAYPRLRGIAETIPLLPDLEIGIVTAIDEEAEVRSSASEKLASIRAEIETLKARIDDRIARLIESPALRPFLQSPKATFRNGRYVLAIKAPQRYEVDGILHDKSQTGATVFVEPQAIVSLGNELSDWLFEERDEVQRILWDLTRRAHDRKDELARLTAALARADLLYAKAKLSIDYGMRAAEAAPVDGELVLKEARHPLLMKLARERRLPSAAGGEPVPISLRLGGDFDVLILTGPNTGGKTVALKTVGLFALMTEMGLHVPCGDGTRIPVFRSFFADIGDEQGIEQSLSTFSAHAAQLCEVLGAADRGSLVLVDELGAGTDPEEGAALGAAILERLLAAGARSLVTTHLGALKSFAYSRPRVENGAVEFDAATLRPTYRLSLGQPGNSHAMLIARRLGMPEDVVRRAEELRGTRGLGEVELIDQVQRLRHEAERDRDRAEAERRETAAARAEAEAEREAAGRERRTVLREADGEVEALYGRLREELLELGKVRDNAALPVRQAILTIEDRIQDVLTRTSFAARRREFARGLKKGKPVWVVSFEREGVVTKINKEKERVTVRLGDVTLETDFQNVTWLRSA